MGQFKELMAPRSLAILVVLGAGLAIWMARELHVESRLLDDIELAEATILETKVESYSHGTGMSRDRTHRPLVRFRFTYDGAEWESQRATPLHRGGTRQWAEEIAGRFKVGETPPCFIPSDQPEKAYLIPVRHWKPMVGLGFGVFLVVAGGVLLIRHRLRTRSRLTHE